MLEEQWLKYWSGQNGTSRAGDFGIRSRRNEGRKPGRYVVEEHCKPGPIPHISRSVPYLCISQPTLPNKPHISAFPSPFLLPRRPALRAPQLSEVLTLHSEFRFPPQAITLYQDCLGGEGRSLLATHRAQL